MRRPERGGRPVSGAHIGIDLGTTYSLVATLTNGSAQVLENAIGELLTPSAVSLGADGEMLVGALARARAVTHPTETALAFKRDMGTDRTVKLGDHELRPEELSALVLGALKRDAEVALGQPIEEAVVTVPAYFGELGRRATRDACDLAGLHVERIINEPTAAALAYGLHERHREMRAVVLDLGGGTFDVTVLEIMEGVIEIQASAGDSRLGGEDFVEALSTYLAAELRDCHGISVEEDPRARARLREAAESAKRRLSTEETARVALPRLGAARRDVEFDLSLDAAEEIWQPLLERLRGPIRRALGDAGAKPDDIDEVLLVGGATRMPCVIRLAASLFARLPLRTLPPDFAVAQGAAIQAGLKSGDAAVADMVVTDVAPFTLGIAVGEKVGSHEVSGLFAPILERGTVLPASRVRTFSTMNDGQTQINLEVYQGEHSLCRDNQQLGELMLKNIPPGPAGKEGVDIRFSYDMNGILDVDATIVSTRKSSNLTIEHGDGRLSARERKAIKKRLQALKFHPRDALPNTTALARGEALYVELVGVERSVLGDALNSMRTALETQDPELIEAARSNLVVLTQDLAKR